MYNITPNVKHKHQLKTETLKLKREPEPDTNKIAPLDIPLR